MLTDILIGIIVLALVWIVGFIFGTMYVSRRTQTTDKYYDVDFNSAFPQEIRHGQFTYIPLFPQDAPTNILPILPDVTPTASMRLDDIAGISRIELNNLYGKGKRF